MADTRAKNERNDITRSFQRVFNFPLDRSTIFDTYQDAEAYAKGDGSDSRKLGKTVYLGQIISVVSTGDSTVKVYKVSFGTGGRVAPYSLEQIAEGSGGGGGGEGGSAATEESFTFKTKNGDVTIPAGSDLTDVVSLLREISDLKSDGVTTAPITNGSGVTIVNRGTDLTTALNSVSRYFAENGGVGKTPSDIDYDGETIIPSGTTIPDALRILVEKVYEAGGLNDAKINNQSVYDPSSKNIAFNIEGADDDINIEVANDLEVPTIYVELNGVSNGTVVLEGEEVKFTVSVYDFNDGTALLATINESTFMTGGTKVKSVYLGDPEEYTFFNQDREQIMVDSNGMYGFSITPTTENIIIFRADNSTCPTQAA